MKILDRFFELFRKKDFYVIDYNKLNNFSISFKEISDNDIRKITEIILVLEDSLSIDEKKANLSNENSLKFENVDDLGSKIRKIINEDYRITYFEAKQKKWDFNYFLTDYQQIYNNTLFICNKLKSLTDGSLGETMYPILAVRKVDKNYYLWDLLDKEE